MQLGFVSATLAELSLEEVLAFAADEGFDCVELMCWPRGEGVCHLDVCCCCNEDQAQHVRNLLRIHGVGVSALGYYPNPLHPDPARRRAAAEHLLRVIETAPKLGASVVTTFVGRDPHKSAEENWPAFLEVWPPLVAAAERHGVTLGIENCPMLTEPSQWPGGANLACTPEAWRRMFREIPSRHLGLNLDPSHLLWQRIDCVRCVREFGRRIVHAHAKDTRIDHDRLYEVGVTGLGWQKPKIPGLGSVEWRPFFSALSEAGYRGPVCIEVEDQAYEGSLEDRMRALRQSKRYVEQFVS